MKAARLKPVYFSEYTPLCHNINDITSKQSLITNGCVSSCYKIGCYLLVAAINSMILRNRSGPYGAVQ